MRRCVLIVILSLFAGPALAQESDACKGRLWLMVQAWLRPERTFEETIVFLRSEAIDYAVFDARSPIAVVEGEVAFTTEHVNATGCQPREQAPQCSIVVSEPRTENSGNLSSSPTFVESDELISIDFNAAGKQTGHGCEVVMTGL